MTSDGDFAWFWDDVFLAWGTPSGTPATSSRCGGPGNVPRGRRLAPRDDAGLDAGRAVSMPERLPRQIAHASILSATVSV